VDGEEALLLGLGAVLLPLLLFGLRFRFAAFVCAVLPVLDWFRLVLPYQRWSSSLRLANWCCHIPATLLAGFLVSWRVGRHVKFEKKIPYPFLRPAGWCMPYSGVTGSPPRGRSV